MGILMSHKSDISPMWQPRKNDNIEFYFTLTPSAKPLKDRNRSEHVIVELPSGNGFSPRGARQAVDGVAARRPHPYRIPPLSRPIRQPRAPPLHREDPRW